MSTKQQHVETAAFQQKQYMYQQKVDLRNISNLDFH